MEGKNKDYEKNDSLKIIDDFRNNMFNSEEYIGLDKEFKGFVAVNTTPLVVTCFLSSVIFLGFGLFLFFSDANVTSYGVIKSAMANKIIALIIMFAISLILMFYGFILLKEARKYYREKNALKNEPFDKTSKDRIWQRTCPKCGESHDIDYPQCPNCKFNYLK